MTKGLDVTPEMVEAVLTGDMCVVGCSELLSFHFDEEDPREFIGRFLSRVLGATDDATRARLFELYLSSAI